MNEVLSKCAQYRDQAKILSEVHAFLHSTPRDQDIKEAKWRFDDSSEIGVFKDRNGVSACLRRKDGTVIPLDIFSKLSDIFREVLKLTRFIDGEELVKWEDRLRQDQRHFDQELTRHNSEVIRVRGEEKELRDLSKKLEAERERNSLNSKALDNVRDNLKYLGGTVVKIYSVFLFGLASMFSLLVVGWLSNWFEFSWLPKAYFIRGTSEGIRGLDQLVKRGWLTISTYDWILIFVGIAFSFILVAFMWNIWRKSTYDFLHDGK